jgi:hypothetical protein
MAKNSKIFTILINHHICHIFHGENTLSKLQFCPFDWANFGLSWAYLFLSSLDMAEEDTLNAFSEVYLIDFQ